MLRPLVQKQIAEGMVTDYSRLWSTFIFKLYSEWDQFFYSFCYVIFNIYYFSDFSGFYPVIFSEICGWETSCFELMLLQPGT